MPQLTHEAHHAPPTEPALSLVGAEHHNKPTIQVQLLEPHHLSQKNPAAQSETAENGNMAANLGQSRESHSSSSSTQKKPHRNEKTLQEQLNIAFAAPEEFLYPKRAKSAAHNLLWRFYEQGKLTIILNGGMEEAWACFPVGNKGLKCATILHIQTEHKQTEHKIPERLTFSVWDKHDRKDGCHVKPFYETLDSSLDEAFLELNGGSESVKWKSTPFVYNAKSGHEVCREIRNHYEQKKKGKPLKIVETELICHWEVEFPASEDHPECHPKPAGHR
ncbi:hypothetical protein N431DRAFT_448445 [Stipitochalara longipes BDJ]|nr:hypothetical protein N431DRAFT_448445 [Stipitochalara longipes BDJ]